MRRTLALVLIFLLFNCQTEEQKKREAEEIVQALISNIQIDNYKSIYELYPSFKNLEGEYWKYKSVEITSTMLKDDGTIEIFAKSNNNQLYFVLDKINKGYKVVQSKGLSAYFNSNIYKYSKNIGCIGLNESDIDIGRICKKNETEFNAIVQSLKKRIEENTFLENHSLTKYGGYYGSNQYVSGDIIVKNGSRFTIPGHSYHIYVKFLDKNDNELYKYKHYNNYFDIPFNSSESLGIMEDIEKNYNKVDVELVILNTNFLENILGEHSKGSSCNYNYNL
ncbi:hypothetical protein [uncultured Winogradskyella sp.]|uniref:hypothetical protein n=1 Tax=uncultured Winogradskyella sp. TaxID=395353 RepID=UPI0035119B65